MRVNKQILQCVVFVGIMNSRGAFIALGTAFLAGARVVSRTNPAHALDLRFLVTCQHVIEQISTEDVFVRINNKGGGSGLFKISKSKMVADSEQDIALFPIEMLHDLHEYKLISLSRRDHEWKYATQWSPDVGDEVATVGLYSREFGESQNLPIVRIGNISRMPEETISVNDRPLQAYLVETRSIIGLSGSPVFLNIPRIRVAFDGTIETLRGSPDHVGAFRVGMMVGYHLTASREDQIVVPEILENELLPSRTPPSMEEMNTGLAVVVPFERILDLVESEAAPKALASIEIDFDDPVFVPQDAPAG